MEIPEMNRRANANKINLNNKTKSENDINLSKAVISNLDMSKNVSVSVENGGNINIKWQSVDLLTDALKLAGFKITPETMKIIQALVTSGFPVSKENVAMMNRAMKLTDSDINKALFFMKNEMPASKENVSMLDGYAKQEIRLTKQIDSFVKEISNISNDDLKNSIINKLLGSGSEKAAYLHEPALSQSVLPEKEAVPPNLKQTLIAEFVGETAERIIEKANEIISKNPGQKQAVMDAATEIVGLKSALVQSKDEFLEVLNRLSKVNAPIEQLNEELNNFLKNGVQKNNVLPSSGSNNTELNPVMSNPVSLSQKDIISLVKSIFGEKSPEVKLTEIIVNKSITDSADEHGKYLDLKDKVIQKFILAPETSDPKKIDEILNKLKTAVNFAKDEYLKQGASATGGKLPAIVDDINKNLDFVNHIKNSTAYMQIPMIINNKDVNAELFVFRHDHKKKSMKGPSDTQSALIALDLLNLGHLETYVQKSSGKINCQFRVEDKNVEDIIKSNINLLDTGLKRINLDLISCSYKKTEEPFNLTDDEPSFDENARTTLEKIHAIDFKA